MILPPKLYQSILSKWKYRWNKLKDEKWPSSLYPVNDGNNHNDDDDDDECVCGFVIVKRIFKWYTGWEAGTQVEFALSVF